MVDSATSQCPAMCEIYYLGCVGMYCRCFGECTSPEVAGCSEPVGAGCHTYYEGVVRESTVADRIVDFIDDEGEGRYEIFGELAYLYRNGLLMSIKNTNFVNLDALVPSRLGEVGDDDQQSQK